MLNVPEYNLPNDGEEQDRQDFQHALYEIVLNGKLALAPILSPENALDIGTGTGIVRKFRLVPRSQPCSTFRGSSCSC